MNFFYQNKGFTFIELLIIVGIIAIVLSIAIPTFSRITSLSRRTVCINNLRKITAAVEQWSFDNNIPNGANISAQQSDDVYKNYFRGGKPVCPSGGQYVINPVGSNPQVQCTNEWEGHKL